MIPITINKVKHSIKRIDELSTGEFIEMSKIDGLDVVKYISWQTGLTIDEAFFAVTDDVLELAIGKAPDITKLPLATVDYIDYKKGVDTVGQRHQVEDSKKKDFELVLFTLAVAQAASTDIDKANELYREYLDKPFYETLPAGFFFYKRFKNGKKIGENICVWLLELIKIRLLKNKLALKG